MSAVELPRIDSERRCSECDADISHKRTYAIVCSTRCRHSRKWRLRRPKDFPKDRQPQPLLPRDCVICGESIKKPVSYNQKFCSDQCRAQNHNAWSLEYYYAHKQRRAESVKRYHSSLKALDRQCQTKFGARPGEYQETYEKQNGKCRICGVERPLTGTGRFDMDHSHKTGKFRGLLCNSCNIGIGYLQDNAEFCRAAGSYLEDGENDLGSF